MFKLIEKPADVGRGRASKPEVNIKENGLISLSKAAMEWSGTFVEVYADENRIGFKFIAKETPNAIKVGKNGSFSAKRMLEGTLKFDGNYSYPAKKEKEYVVITISDGKAVAKRTRKPKAQPAAQQFPS